MKFVNLVGVFCLFLIVVGCSGQKNVPVGNVIKGDIAELAMYQDGNLVNQQEAATNQETIDGFLDLIKDIPLTEITSEEFGEINQAKQESQNGVFSSTLYVSEEKTDGYNVIFFEDSEIVVSEIENGVWKRIYHTSDDYPELYDKVQDLYVKNATNLNEEEGILDTLN